MHAYASGLSDLSVRCSHPSEARRHAARPAGRAAPRSPLRPYTKMKLSLLVLVSLLACVWTQARPPVSDTALEDALNDKRFIQRQLKCALGEAPCDPIGKRLKTLAPLVLRGACPQCSPQETKQIQRTLSYVQRNFPAEWAKIVRQYAG